VKRLLVIAGLVATVSSAPALAQDGKMRMYKCQDATGKVYYSDKMNPECANGAELNRQGVVMQKKQAAKPAPPAGQAAQSEADSATLLAQQDKARRDRALMATYTTDEEIDAARDRSLAIPEQGVKSLEAKLEKSNQQLTDLKQKADTIASQKKALPPQLLEEVGATQKEIGSVQAEIAQRKAQAEAIRVKFDADKQRFRELGGRTTQASK
jgi:uncharacterized protein DUF4124